MTVDEFMDLVIALREDIKALKLRVGRLEDECLDWEMTDEELDAPIRARDNY